MKRKVHELRPTQFALGMVEVSTKREKLLKMSENERDEYLHDHKVPIVLCRQGQAHLIDHHHLVRACWEAGVHHVVTEVKEDLSHLSDDAFWKAMVERNWTHLFDQLGNGPHEPHHLPVDIRGLADDPYRSLAWAVREAGVFEKSPEPFCEFRWADFFRKRLQIPRTENGFDKVFEAAKKLAIAPEARHLPGFKGRSSQPKS
jgi:hypothetical protein